jgi:hypothetical protein
MTNYEATVAAYVLYFQALDREQTNLVELSEAIETAAQGLTDTETTMARLEARDAARPTVEDLWQMKRAAARRGDNWWTVIPHLSKTNYGGSIGAYQTTRTFTGGLEKSQQALPWRKPFWATVARRFFMRRGSHPFGTKANPYEF